MEGDASLRTSRPKLLGRGRDGERRGCKHFECPKDTRNAARGRWRRFSPGPAPAPAVRRFGGLAGPPNVFVSPGFPRSLNLRGGRWPRPPLVSLPRKYRRSARCRAQPLYLLTPSGRFATFGGNSPQGWRFLSAHLRVALRFAQQPTGHTLPSGAGRAGSLRPWAQTFLKLLAKKAAAGGLFRQADAPTAIWLSGR